MKTRTIEEHTDYLSKLYYVNELHKTDERFAPGKRVILKSRENIYEGTVTGFFNFDKACLNLRF